MLLGPQNLINQQQDADEFLQENYLIISQADGFTGFFYNFLFSYFYVYFIYFLFFVPLFVQLYTFFFPQQKNKFHFKWDLFLFVYISGIAIAFWVAYLLRNRNRYRIEIINSRTSYVDNLIRRRYFISFYNSHPEFFLECIILNPLDGDADLHNILAQNLACLINLRRKGAIYLLPEILLFWICIFTAPILGKDFKLYYYFLIVWCLSIAVLKLRFLYLFLQDIRFRVFNPILRSISYLRLSVPLQSFLESEIDDALLSIFSYFRLLWRLLR